MIISLIISIVTAFVVTFIVLPIVIKVSRSIDLFDIPDRRKVHNISTPSLGGIAIFSGSVLAILIVLQLTELAELKFFMAGLVIIFILGVRDDVSSLIARHKLLTQIFAAFLVVFLSDVKLTGFYGIFGIHSMPEWFNIPFSIFVIVTLINAFNFIDGIDGLAASLAIFVLTSVGITFISADRMHLAVVCFSIAGALVAFLFFNWYPSKVFMGDTGSMVLGFVISCVVIQFINLAPSVTFIRIHSSVGIAIALMILPIFDTLRVFTIRFMKGRSPLDPDRNHLHHGLLQLGMNHAEAVFTLLAVNITILGTALFLDSYMGNGFLMLIVFSMALIYGAVLDFKLHQLKDSTKTFKVLPSADLYLPKSA